MLNKRPILLAAGRSLSARQARLASQTRSGKPDELIDAITVMAHMKAVLHSKLLQVGGDATTGRGLVAATVMSQ